MRMNQKASNPELSIDHLKEISSWISSVNDLDQLLELIIETATRMMQAKASSLLLLDEKTRKLYFKVATGEKKNEVKAYQIKLGQGIAGTVAQKGEPLLIPDVSKDPRWYKEISESTGFRTSSIACVPMKVDAQTIGVVQVIDKIDGSPFVSEDMKILKVFAELAALAITNAREIEQVRIEKDCLLEELGTKHRIIGRKRITKAAFCLAG